jgi:mono/diheme cytochrome c family protein
MSTGTLRIALAMCANTALSVVALASARAQSAPAADSTSQAAIDAGRKVFHGQGNCVMCHGSNLEGTPIAPTLQAHDWKDAKGGGYVAIVAVVTNGVSGTAMVSHPGGISDDDVRKVAAYVWAVGHGKAKP